MVGLLEDGCQILEGWERGFGIGVRDGDETYILNLGFRAFLRNPLLVCLRMLIAGRVVLRSRSCLVRLLAGWCAGACEAASFLATLLWG